MSLAFAILPTEIIRPAGRAHQLDQCRDQRFKTLPIAWRVPVGTVEDVEGICQKGPSGTRGKLGLARKKGYWL